MLPSRAALKSTRHAGAVGGYLSLQDLALPPSSAARVLLAGNWLARVAHLAFGAIATWGAVTMLAEGPMFPVFLMAGGIGFVAVGIWLAPGDTPMQRWLASRGLPAPLRDLAY